LQFRSFPTNAASTPVAHSTGYQQFARRITAPATVAVDGMWGVDWEAVVSGLTAALGPCAVVQTFDYLRPAAALREHFQPWLTENPVFGRLCDRPLSDYFAMDQLQDALTAAREQAAERGAPVLVVGPYALGAVPADLGLYCDLPREEIIRRQVSGAISNLGEARPISAGAKYKRAYYVEWPLLEGHKRLLLRAPDSPVDFYLDCQNDGAPVAVSLEGLRAAVADLTARPFRCKPFFMPGVWGGQRLKDVANLPKEWPNCAWDFEVVAPENAVAIDLGGGAALTVPFPVLLWLRAPELMGEAVYRQFGEFFPIRINYLDTMGGTNLSLQVHPHHTYMREHFGEPIGQDESYYIVEQEPGARVYLGLKESTSREGLREAVRRAEEEYVPFAVTDYVNEWEAKVGDLFLIPAGTVHCSGASNLVLEVSSTPYWYTFKIYDYLRPDLEGKPRPINAAFGFDVIDFTRKTEWVKRHLIPEPTLLRQEAGGEEYHIGSHAFTFYGVNRVHLTGTMAQQTEGGFLLLTVTAGEGVAVLPAAGDEPVVTIAYLETYVVPASFSSFQLKAIGAKPCQVIKSYVRR
jgi:mannose-6-phosphate isomerase class I